MLHASNHPVHVMREVGIISYLERINRSEWP